MTDLKIDPKDVILLPECKHFIQEERAELIVERLTQ